MVFAPDDRRVVGMMEITVVLGRGGEAPLLFLENGSRSAQLFSALREHGMRSTFVYLDVCEYRKRRFYFSVS